MNRLGVAWVALVLKNKDEKVEQKEGGRGELAASANLFRLSDALPRT
jgi:hypothetical protein